MLLILCFKLLALFLLLVPPQDAPAAQELSAAHSYDGPPPVDLLADDPEIVYLPAAERPPGCAGDVMPPVFVYLPPAEAAVDVMPPVLVYLPPAVIIAAESAGDVMSPVFVYLPPVDLLVEHPELVYLPAAGCPAGCAGDAMPPVLVYLLPTVIIAAGSAADVVHPVLVSAAIAVGSAIDIMYPVLFEVVQAQQVEEYNQREVLMLEQKQADQREVLMLEQKQADQREVLMLEQE
ncbi:hypothetical protein BDR04DRAFT_1213132 [Suillus decipiens]|nr:hypothetical protein BDR04DRAFT_1213132 [Suillus decipiens]